VICDLLVPYKRRFPSLSVPLGLSIPQQRKSPSSPASPKGALSCRRALSPGFTESNGAESYPFRVYPLLPVFVLVTRAADCTTASRHAARIRACSSALTCGGEVASTRDKHDMHDMKE
jgi:hypothetical protein